MASTLGSVAFALLIPVPGSPLTRLLWWVGVLGAGVGALLVVRGFTVRLVPLATLLDLTLVFPEEAPSRFSVARRARSVDEALDVLEDLQEADSVQAAAEASLALVVALETHDSATRGHAERVRLLADLVGQELGVSVHERVRLRWSALLHDLGKLHVHGDILNKPGRPSDEEWEQLQRHPLEGDRLVQPLRPWLGDWVDAVVEHHERFDGGGYPHGRAGHEISLAGRIVGVVDAYETMTARRAYKQPMTADEARSELVACAGGQFDPEIVRAFLSVSLPSPSRRTLLLGWLTQLPIVAWFGRLPRQPSTAMLGATAAAASIVAAGLAPTAAPPVPVLADGPPPAAVDGTTQPPPSLPTSPSRPGPEAPAQDTAARDTDDEASGTRPDGDAVRPPPSLPPHPPDEEDQAESPAPTGPRPEQPSDGPSRSDLSHRPATHVAASTLYLGSPATGAARWFPLVTDEPQDQQVPDPDADGRPGVRLPAIGWGDGAAPPTLAWTLQLPATVLSSPAAQVILHLGLDTVGRPTTVGAQLLDCAPDVRSCREIASGETTAFVRPTAQRWTEVTIDLGPVATLIDDGRVLALVVSAPGGVADRPALAIDTAETPSRLTGTSLAPRNLPQASPQP